MSLSTYDLIVKINTTIEDIYLDKVEGYSVVGDIRSNAYQHPIQYRAITTTRPGDDDPFEGIGWTPSQALRNLLKTLEAL